MKKPEITSLSSRGQVVIPQEVRDSLNLREGEKFIVMGEGDVIILKKLEIPSFKGIDKIIKKTKELEKP
ncbi:AbrB family transcriptional regulator [Candidatus Woesearchaeota archaeon]|nr:AbrB family transcriptional regulator [Candidatus Woesearchaeota archaeon]|tara:strand:+ start:15685 stop:15891 length:207 start_codon:yes stop_codon:yes gene_type:complete